MLRFNNMPIPAKNNLAVNSYPHWSQIAVFDPLEPDLDSGVYSVQAQKATVQAQDTDEDDITTAAAAGEGFVTLINASPHDWVRTGMSSYQMTKWDWPTVRAGMQPN